MFRHRMRPLSRSPMRARAWQPLLGMLIVWLLAEGVSPGITAQLVRAVDLRMTAAVTVVLGLAIVSYEATRLLLIRHAAIAVASRKRVCAQGRSRWCAGAE